MTHESSLTLPLVSVVIPCFNQASYLMESVLSVQAAYAGNLEILVVNDGSTHQNTTRYLHEISECFSSVRIIQQVNAGLSAARNKGIQEARGEYIQLLDADDLLLPQKISQQIAHFQMCADLDISICNFSLSDEWLTDFSKQANGLAGFDFTTNDFLFKWERGFAVPIHCALFHRRVFVDVKFDVKARAKEDWQFWCMLALLNRKMAYIHFSGAIYRQHSQSMRRSYVRMGQAWVEATVKLNEKVNATHPLFFDSAMSWFTQFYKTHPEYLAEICALGAPTNTPNFFKPKLDRSKPLQLMQESITSKLQGFPSLNAPPLITVIIPVFNHYEFLEECLSSLAAQGSTAFEVICVEDYSTDERVRQLMSHLSGKFKNLHIITHQKNTGILLSQDEAIARATGQFIIFLDCDDALVEGALKSISEEINTHPEVDYFFSDRLDISDSGSVIRKVNYGGYDDITPSDNIRDDLLDGMVASHLKAIRRTTYLQIGAGNLRFDGIQDWEIALKIADHGGIFKYIPQVLYRHRIHSKSVTHSSRVSQLRKTNNLRRYFLEKWLRLPAQNNLYKTGLEETVLYTDLELITPKKLREKWRLGKRCVLRLADKPSVGMLNFIREFNSYFDLIEYSRPETFASLIGYVWSSSILSRIPSQKLAQAI